MTAARRLPGLVIGALVCLVAHAAGDRIEAQEPARSVIHLWVMRSEVEGYQLGYRSVTAGTAFLIGADGRAITNAHVVNQVRTSPRTFTLIATVGDEFFSAHIVCASVLAPAADGSPMLGRDVAEIQLVPPEISAQGFNVGGIERWRPHRGPMPQFRALAFGRMPAAGDPVRVLGYGYRPGVVVPYEWSATGAVGTLGAAPDGTAVFTVKFDRQAEPGHSGSPVLNARGEVVGMFTWLRQADPTVGVAIARSALNPACP